MELTKNTRVRFDELTHRYLLFEEDGGMRLLKGVTTLMREHGLSPDYSGIDPEVLRRAAERARRCITFWRTTTAGSPSRTPRS